MSRNCTAAKQRQLHYDITIDDLNSSIDAEILVGGIHVPTKVVLSSFAEPAEEQLTDPVGAPDLQKFRVIDMYTSISMIL